MENQAFLASRDSDLEFALHRSQYMRILSNDRADKLRAVTYLRQHVTASPHMMTKYETEINKLLAATLWTDRMEASPYKDVLTETRVHGELEGKLAQEFCAKLGMSKQLPLAVVGDIATGGALSRIEKGRRVMQQRKNGWSIADELPVSCTDRRDSCF